MARAPTFVSFCVWLGVTLSHTQRVLASVTFDRVEPRDLKGRDRELAAKLFGPGVEEIPESARRVLALVKGARCGGTYVFAALYAVWRMLVADLSTLAPGEVAAALVGAPSVRQAKQALRFALGAVDNHPQLARLVVSRSELGFTLKRDDGRLVAFEAAPATRGGYNFRSKSLLCFCLTEVCFLFTDDYAVSDVDCFTAGAPRVLPGGMCVLESTPHIAQGLLHDMFVKNFGEPRTAIAALAPTLLMLDTKRNREVVAAELERDPDNARREFFAEWTSGGAGLVFGAELLSPAIDRNLALGERPANSVITIGGDLGIAADHSCFTAVARHGACITVVDALELKPKRGAPLKLSDVIAQGCAFAKKYGAKTIHLDHWSIHAAREHTPEGFNLMPITGGQEAAAKRVMDVRRAFREGNVKIPGPLSRLGVQLSQILSRPTPGGGLQIILPRRGGSHLDFAAAFLVGAAIALTTYDVGDLKQPTNVHRRTFAVQHGY